MGYFPFFIDIEKKHCLIVGGGIVALRKIEVLKDYGVIFHIVAPVIHSEIATLAKMEPSRYHIHQRQFEISDLDEKEFVVAASSDENLNHQISVTCKEKKILVNVVDVKEDCSFIVPAILHEESYDIAVSSGGRSPAAASYLKRKVKEAIPEHYSNLVKEMGEFRNIIKAEVDSQSKRADLFQRLLEMGLEHGCHIDRAMVDELIKEYQ